MGSGGAHQHGVGGLGTIILLTSGDQLLAESAAEQVENIYPIT
jgi:hypothetical protein